MAKSNTNNIECFKQPGQVKSIQDKTRHGFLTIMKPF